MLLISALGNHRQMNRRKSLFQVSHGYRVRPYLKKKKKMLTESKTFTF